MNIVTPEDFTRVRNQRPIPDDADVYMLIPNTYIDMSDCDKVAVNIQSENGYLGKLRFLENYEEVNVLNTKIEINPLVNIM